MQTTTTFLCPAGKVILALTILLFSFTPAKAETKTAISNSGNGWSVSSNWSPSGVPQDGDIVIIPNGFTLNVKGNIYSTSIPALGILIYGNLDFEPSGKLELAVTSTIQLPAGGSINSNNSSSELITIGGVTKFNGQVDGSLAGPMYSSSTTGVSPLGFSQGALAIRLYSFQARLISQGVRLNWTASSDHASDFFIVQRSSDGIQWNDIHNIPVAAYMNEVTGYQYTDHMVLRGTSFYRILLSNADGNKNYSRTIPIVTDIQHIKLFPNPASSEARITWKQTSASQPVYVRVADIMNSTILMRMVKAGDQFYNLDTRSLPAGIYRIQVTDQISFSESSSLVVTK